MLADRFWSKVRKSDGCWEWAGTCNGQGYGQFWDGTRNVGAHRYAWTLIYGDPGKLVVCHRCDNPPCVRPDHLFSGTTADNVRDMWAKGRNEASIAKANTRKTHCPKGHPYKGRNLMVGNKRGGKTARLCRTCYYAKSNQRKLELRDFRPKYGGRPASTAKLDRDQIIAIYRARAAGETGSSLAARFGVSKVSMSQILRGISYKADVAAAKAALGSEAPHAR